MRVLLAAVLAAVVAGTAWDRGYNANIAWSNRLSDSLTRAKSEGRAAMVLIHKSWCGACKRLKTVFGHHEIETLSREFVMVNLEDDEEPADAAYKPDGAYIPRVFFVRDGTVLPVHNTAGNPQYKYYYSSEDQIVASMKAALGK